MSSLLTSLRQAARPFGFLAVGVLSTLGALSFTHIGPAQAGSSGASLAALAARLKRDEAALKTLQSENAALKAKTAPLSVSGKDLTITGVNVHIVSGSGTTSDGTEDADGNPVPGKPLSGRGNLIIGYNAKGNDQGAGDVRTGSHNLILGGKNSYSSYGGLVVGYDNVISGRYASVSGGSQNKAIAGSSTVSGGANNKASGNGSAVSGGYGVVQNIGLAWSGGSHHTP